MSRYLTAAKICLLALVSTYVSGIVPAVAAVPVLSFLVQHVLRTIASDLHPSNAMASLTVDELQSHLAHLPSGVPGRTVWDWLLKKLWEIDSLDALHLFFETLGDSLMGTKPQSLMDVQGSVTGPAGRIRLSRMSPLGVFVRRAQVEFTRLQYDDGVALWKSFALYRESTRFMWRRRNPSVARAGFDVNVPTGRDEKLQTILYRDTSRALEDGCESYDDIEALLEFQIERMQAVSQRLPDQMKNRIMSMIRLGVMAPSRSHYIKYLDAWKAGDYPSAFDNLHRYFDYTMKSRDKTYYQYALLNLAVLQADFGCFSDAVAAMHETISVARENKDTGCLNFTLSWLFHFIKANPGELNGLQQAGVLGTDKEALAFLKAKAKEAEMWHLLSTSFLAEARQGQLRGESAAISFEGIVKSSHLILGKNLISIMASYLNVESSMFFRLGQRFLACSCNEIFLECYANESSQEDLLHSLCRAAFIDASRGRFRSALSICDDATSETLRTLKHQHFWTACMALLTVRQALYRSEIATAERYLTQLRANPGPSQDITFNTWLHAIDLELRRGHYSKAMDLLETYQRGVEGEEDEFQRIKMMTLKAQVYECAGMSQKGFSVAIRAASLSYKARYLVLLWEAISLLCKILISIKEFLPAIKLLKAMLPQILETEDCELTARSFSYLADAYMGMAGEAWADLPRQKEQINKALECVARGFDEYSSIEDVRGQCEMMAKKAVIMRLNQDFVLANDCSAKYLDLWKLSEEDRA